MRITDTCLNSEQVAVYMEFRFLPNIQGDCLVSGDTSVARFRDESFNGPKSQYWSDA